MGRQFQCANIIAQTTRLAFRATSPSAHSAHKSGDWGSLSKQMHAGIISLQSLSACGESSASLVWKGPSWGLEAGKLSRISPSNKATTACAAGVQRRGGPNGVLLGSADLFSNNHRPVSESGCSSRLSTLLFKWDFGVKGLSPLFVSFFLSFLKKWPSSG